MKRSVVQRMLRPFLGLKGPDGEVCIYLGGDIRRIGELIAMDRYSITIREVNDFGNFDFTVPYEAIEYAGVQSSTEAQRDKRRANEELRRQSQLVAEDQVRRAAKLLRTHSAKIEAALLAKTESGDPPTEN